MVEADIRARKMASDLEEFLGSRILDVPRGVGYDVLAESGAEEKHIEAKGIDQRDDFFAINGFAGVCNLLLDKRYFVYFCDVRTNEVLVTSGSFVFRTMGWNEAENCKQAIEEWAKLGKSIREEFEVTVDGRIRFRLRHPIREIIREIKTNIDQIEPQLLDTIFSLWKYEAQLGWRKEYSR